MLLSAIYKIWMILITSGPYILFGFMAAGLIHTFVPSDKIVTVLGKRNWRSVFLASLCGVPLPLCSCSVLPTAVTLRQKGASRGATTSFLISTPETGVDSIAMTYGMMDLTMTILRPFIAFITALFAGITVNRWGDTEEEETEKIHSCCHANNETSETVNVRPWWAETWHYAFGELSNNLAHWLALGFILSGVIAAWIPDWFFQGWVGQGFSSLLIMLIISMPMYICASGSTPIAAAMIAKGLSPGAALVFLLAGPATNIGSIPILYKILGRRSTILYLLAIIVISLYAGHLVNLYYGQNEITPTMAIEQTSGESAGIVGILSALFLLYLLIKGMWQSAVPTQWTQIGKKISSMTGIQLSWKKFSLFILMICVVSILQTCFLIVGPGEKGAIVELGKPTAVNLSPGIYMHLPYPFAQGHTLRVREVRNVDVGFRSKAAGVARTAPWDTELQILEESLYLTGDENIVDLSSQAEYRVNDAEKYLFGIADPEPIIRGAVISALTEVMAGMNIETTLTTARHTIEIEVTNRARQIINHSMPGTIELIAVRLIRIHAPAEAHQAFRDVASAEEDKERQIYEAYVETERTLHLARGEAVEIVESAEADKRARIQKAHGDTAAFKALAECDMKWPIETRMRLRFETVDYSLLPVSKTILPNDKRWPDFDLWFLDSSENMVIGTDKYSE